MGTTFANLHVFTDDKEEVLKSLKRLRPKSSYYIGQNQGWTTVLGENISTGKRLAREPGFYQA
ncbi:hypothetical protein D3C81_1546450 [compost metagenome]